MRSPALSRFDPGHELLGRREIGLTIWRGVGSDVGQELHPHIP
jgi:hypothetical protein